MNPSVLEFLASLRSIRHYKADPVPQHVIDEAVRVGQRAPSTSNLQPYHVVQVDEPSLRQGLFDAMVTQDFVRAAPVVLVTCVDWSKLNLLIEHSDADGLPSPSVLRLLGAVEATVFTYQLTLALMAEGLGVCLIASPYTSLEKVAELLQIPKNLAMPLHMIVAGYPADNPPLRPRLPIESVFSKDRYREPDVEQLVGFFSNADKMLKAEGYFEKYTEVEDLRGHYRLKFGHTGHSRTWEALRQQLERFF